MRENPLSRFEGINFVNQYKFHLFHLIPCKEGNRKFLSVLGVFCKIFFSKYLTIHDF